MCEKCHHHDTPLTQFLILQFKSILPLKLILELSIFVAAFNLYSYTPYSYTPFAYTSALILQRLELSTFVANLYSFKAI